MRPSDKAVPLYTLNLPQFHPLPKKHPAPLTHHSHIIKLVPPPLILHKDPVPVAAPCVSSPLGQSWPPAQTSLLGPPTSPPTETSFPNPPSLIQSLRSRPHAVSPFSPPILLVLSPLRIPAPSLLQSCSYKKAPAASLLPKPVATSLSHPLDLSLACSPVSHSLFSETVRCVCVPETPLSFLLPGRWLPLPSPSTPPPYPDLWVGPPVHLCANHVQVSVSAQRSLAIPITSHWAVFFHGIYYMTL